MRTFRGASSGGHSGSATSRTAFWNRFVFHTSESRRKRELGVWGVGGESTDARDSEESDMVRRRDRAMMLWRRFGEREAGRDAAGTGSVM